MKNETREKRYTPHRSKIEELSKMPPMTIFDASKITGIPTMTIFRVAKYYGIDLSNVIVKRNKVTNTNTEQQSDAVSPSNPLSKTQISRLDRYAKVIDKVRDSNSLSEIAEKVGVTRERIRQVVNDMGIHDKVKDYFQMRKDLALAKKINSFENLEELFLKSTSFNEIAHELKIEYSKLMVVLGKVLESEQVKTLKTYQANLRDKKFFKKNRSQHTSE